jgi:heme/copper-type cytochrome/quinol oxidase subunit 4
MKANMTIFHLIALELFSVGISALTNTPDGRTRWMKSHSMRTKIISFVLSIILVLITKKTYQRKPSLKELKKTTVI